QGRLGLDRTEMHAHLFQGGQHVGAVAKACARLRQGHVAQHHAATGQALAQAGLDRVSTRAVGQQFDQDGRVGRDHPSFLPPGSSANLPRTREIASSTLLRRMMRLPSSSTLSTLPLVNPSASRTALGRVIWPRSATVASIASLPCTERYGQIIHTSLSIPNWAYSGDAASRCRRPVTITGVDSPADAAAIRQRSPTMADTFSTHATLEVGAQSLTYASLPRLGERFDIARLPFAMKILLENLLRHEDGVTVLPKHIEAVANWDPKAEPDIEIAFMPARVVLQDFTGVPCVVDLAAMRGAVVRLGGRPEQINPLIPSELVIDHSVQVDVFGRP